MKALTSLAKTYLWQPVNYFCYAFGQGWIISLVEAQSVSRVTCRKQLAEKSGQPNAMTPRQSNGIRFCLDFLTSLQKETQNNANYIENPRLSLKDRWEVWPGLCLLEQHVTNILEYGRQPRWPHELCSASIAMEVWACMQRPRDFYGFLGALFWLEHLSLRDFKACLYMLIPCIQWRYSFMDRCILHWLFHSIPSFVHFFAYVFVCSFMCWRLIHSLLIYHPPIYHSIHYRSTDCISSATGQVCNTKGTKAIMQKKGAISNQHRNDRQTLNDQNSEVNCVEMNGIW